MMNKDEAVQKLATVGRLSIAHAEDLYDSFFPKPVVPQCVADWYEGNKQNLDLNLSGLVFDLATKSEIYYQEEFKEWVNSNKKTFITTLVNMHQFGYEVESEPRYTVRLKGLTSKRSYLNYLIEDDRWYLNDEVSSVAARTHHTRGELEKGSFGEVFDNPMFEVKEVTEEVGEIRDVFLKPHDFVDPEWSLKDAIGDSIVTLVVLCLQLGYDVEECLTIAYNDIKDRQGVMIDDNFIKTKTRQPVNDTDDSTTSIASN